MFASHHLVDILPPWQTGPDWPQSVSSHFGHTHSVTLSQMCIISSSNDLIKNLCSKNLFCNTSGRHHQDFKILVLTPNDINYGGVGTRIFKYWTFGHLQGPYSLHCGRGWVVKMKTYFFTDFVQTGQAF